MACLLPLIWAEAASSATLVVGLEWRGSHAIERCAEDLMNRQQSFSSASADASSSLDRVHERFGVRRYRALFREAARVPTASAARDFAAALRARTFQSRGRAAPRAAADPNRTSAESLFHVYAVDLPETADLREALDAFRADPHVRFAQLDQAVVPDQSIAFDDPFLFSSGAWGQPYRDLWGLERAGVIDSWPITLGEGIVVAVVDTGIDYRHPDLAGQLWINPGEDLDGDGLATAADLNGVDDDGNGFIDDLRGYDFTGYTAGLIAGEASPGDLIPSMSADTGRTWPGRSPRPRETGLASPASPRAQRSCQ